MRLSEMTKKTKVIIEAAAAVVAAAAVITVMLLVGKTDAYRVIKIFDMSGKADVERSAVVLDAYKGMNLESGDVLSVHEDSTAQISLDGDKFILLDRNTVMEMKAEGTPSDSRTTINLVSGTILNELTQPLSDHSVYEVNTPKATMAVRGTEFTVSVTPLEDGTYVTDLNTLHGNVAVQLIDKDGGNKGEEVRVPPGMAVTIKTEHSDENKEDDVLETGNSFFVLRAADAPDDAPPEEQFVAVGEGDDPVYEADYSRLSDNIKLQAVKSDTEMRTVLEDKIVERLMSSVNDQEALAEVLTSPGNVGRPDFTAATGTAGSALSSDMSGEIPDETGESESAPEPDNTAETNIPDETGESEAVSSVTDPTETEPAPAETAVPEEDAAEETVTASAEETGGGTDSSADAEDTEGNTDNSDTDAEETESETSDTSENEESETEDLTENTVPEGTSVNIGTDISDVSVTGSGGGTPDIPKCTVTFMLEGSELSTRTVNIGSKLGTLPVIPPRDGHTGRWIDSSTINDAEMLFAQEVDASTVVNCDMIVVLIYSPEDMLVTLTYPSDDGEITVERTVTYGEPIGTLPTAPEGRYFVWTDESGTEIDETYIVTQPVHLTASSNIIVVAVRCIPSYDETAVVARFEVGYGDTASSNPAFGENFGVPDWSSDKGMEPYVMQADGKYYMVSDEWQGFPADFIATPDNNSIVIPYVDITDKAELYVDSEDFVMEDAPSEYTLPEYSGTDSFTCWKITSISGAMKNGGTETAVGTPMYMYPGENFTLSGDARIEPAYFSKLTIVNGEGTVITEGYITENSSINEMLSSSADYSNLGNTVPFITRSPFDGSEWFFLDVNQDFFTEDTTVTGDMTVTRYSAASTFEIIACVEGIETAHELVSTDLSDQGYELPDYGMSDPDRYCWKATPVNGPIKNGLDTPTEADGDILYVSAGEMFLPDRDYMLEPVYLSTVSFVEEDGTVAETGAVLYNTSVEYMAAHADEFTAEGSTVHFVTAVPDYDFMTVDSDTAVYDPASEIEDTEEITCYNYVTIGDGMMIAGDSSKYEEVAESAGSSNLFVSIKTDAFLKLSGSTTTHRLIIGNLAGDASTNTHLFFDNFSLERFSGDHGSAALDMKEGSDLILTLLEGTSNKLAGANESCAIKVRRTSSLVIDGTGTLIAYYNNGGSAASCAVIGCQYNFTYGDITIMSGTLKLSTNYSSALIGMAQPWGGAAEEQDNGVITIGPDAVIEGSGKIGGYDYTGNTINVSSFATIDSRITINGNVTWN